MSRPYKCPVCEGSGEVPNYDPTIEAKQECHACDGQGIVWEPEAVTHPPWRYYEPWPWERGEPRYGSNTLTFPPDGTTIFLNSTTPTFPC